MIIGHADLVLRKVIDVIRDTLYLPNEPITADTNLTDDLGFDSLDLITAFLDMEEEFGVEFPDDGPSRFVRVGDIALYLKQRMLPMEAARRARSGNEGLLLAA